LQDLFADAHNLASLITDVNGNPITKPSNFSFFCENIIQKTELGCINCFKSDAIIGNYNPKGPYLQQCLSGGLWDAGASISVGGKHIANWLIGQVRIDAIDINKHTKYAEEIGADKQAYLEAYNKVPEMSVGKFTKIANLLFFIANELSEKGFNNLQLKNKINQIKFVNKLLKDSEERLKVLFDDAPDAMLLADPETAKIIDVNKAATLLFKKQKKDIVGLLYYELHPNKNIEISKSSFNSHFGVRNDNSKNIPTENAIICSDGTEIPIEILGQSIKIGDKILMLGTFRNITERKKMETLIEYERSLYLDLVNTQPAGIYLLRVFSKDKWEKNAWKNANNPPYKMELISQKFCEILEVNKETFELYPGIIIDLLHPDDKDEFVIKNEEANTKISPFKWDCRLIINNNIKWIHFESIPRKIHNGDILFTGIIYDVTEQKIAQEELIKKNKDLDYLNKFMINREVRMAEMKKEVNDLLVSMGKEKRYL